MHKHRIAAIAGYILLLVGSVLPAMAYVKSTIAQYEDGVPCDLTGFARVLQAAHFIAPGGCSPIIKGKCSNAICEKSKPPTGPAINGHCELSGTACVCL